MLFYFAWSKDLPLHFECANHPTFMVIATQVFSGRRNISVSKVWDRFTEILYRQLINYYTLATCTNNTKYFHLIVFKGPYQSKSELTCFKFEMRFKKIFESIICVLSTSYLTCRNTMK